jgi:hypothetical protein
VGASEVAGQRVALSESRPVFGTDEMNFADIPCAALTDHLGAGQKTLVFEDDVHDKATKQRVHRKSGFGKKLGRSCRQAIKVANGGHFAANSAIRESP